MIAASIGVTFLMFLGVAYVINSAAKEVRDNGGVAKSIGTFIKDVREAAAPTNN